MNRIETRELVMSPPCWESARCGEGVNHGMCS